MFSSRPAKNAQILNILTFKYVLKLFSTKYFVPILKVRLSQNEFMKSSIFQNTKDFALKVFTASLGLPGCFFGIPIGFPFYDITHYRDAARVKNPGGQVVLWWA